MKRFSILFFIFSLITASYAQNPEKRIKHFNLEKGLAIQGYDPVAYFSVNKAVKGKKDFAQTIDGVTYYFSSAINKETFMKNPSYFEPQFGGWCAYALGFNGKKVEIDPATFKIINGKLYLFYNAYFNNTLETWNKDETNLKNKAEINWGKLYN